MLLSTTTPDELFICFCFAFIEISHVWHLGQKQSIIVAQNAPNLYVVSFFVVVFFSFSVLFWGEGRGPLLRHAPSPTTYLPTLFIPYDPVLFTCSTVYSLLCCWCDYHYHWNKSNTFYNLTIGIRPCEMNCILFPVSYILFLFLPVCLSFLYIYISLSFDWNIALK